MFEKEGESKQAEQTGNDTVGVLYRIWLKKSGVMRLFWNERLQHGEQMNRNFGIKLFLSLNWGACVYIKVWEEERGNSKLPGCVIKESIRCESVSVDLDAMSESAIL